MAPLGLQVLWSSSPAHQKLDFPFSVSPFCGDLQWISRWLGCLPIHTHKILQHFTPRALQTPLEYLLLLNHHTHSPGKVPPPSHKTVLCFLPALKIATPLRIPFSLPELPAAKEARALFSEISWNNGNPWMECPACGQKLKAVLDFHPQHFVLDLFLYKYRFAHIYVSCAANSRLSLISFFRRLVLIVGGFFSQENKKRIL